MGGTYDLVTVGGGLGGAALAKVMAEAGARVLVVERTTEFRDRVRGEVLVPWGCQEAKKLGLFDLLLASCAHELRWWRVDVEGMPVLARDLIATTPLGLPTLTYYHPTMQQLVVDAARAAGAEVRRGTTVRAVHPGREPAVTLAQGSATERVAARLVVGADGRASAVRRWGDFSVEHARPRRFFAGVLMDGLDAPEDTLHSRFLPRDGLMNWIFPQGGGRVRTYVGFHAATGYPRLSGAHDVPRFIETAVRTGVPEQCFATATVAGPLVTFDATDNWVAHPYRDGVALIGDAAATSDPTWGQGMSMTLRDVGALGTRLTASDDWAAAADAYAADHARAARACRTADTWYTDLLLEIGSEAEAIRQRALPLILADQTRLVDTPISGPDLCTPDAAARARFFGVDHAA